MTRQSRLDIAAYPQHIVQRGNNRGRIFGGDDDRRYFRQLVASAAAKHAVAVHAYVLMSNHVHLLATPAHDGGIGRLMQSVGVRYVHWFNRRYGRTGTLWEGRYRASVIEADRYLLACHRYIELNPVRASYSGELAFVKLRYKAPGGKESTLIQTPVTAQTNDIPLSETLFAASVASFGQLLKGTDYLGGWDFAAAEKLAQENKGADRFGYRSEFLTLLRLAEVAER